MKVIFDKNIAESVADRMTLLELDTLFQPGLVEPITAYAVLENTSIPITEIPNLERNQALHNSMMVEYRNRNWNFCEHALEYLLGKWGREIDSFYELFADRIAELKNADLPEDWTGIVVTVPDASEINNSA